MDEKLTDIVLSHNAIAFTVDHARPVITLDFVGYIGMLEDTKDKVNYMVDICGNFELISGDKNRPALPKKLKLKWYKKLLKHGFLEETIEPFPEFSEHFNIPIDPEKAEFYPLHLIQSVKHYNEGT